MALVDLTRVDPYGPQVEAQGRALAQRNASLQNVFNQITNGIQAGQARRARQDEQDRIFRDREYGIINAATSQLDQAHTNNKFTDVQLQQAGQEFKSDFYAAVKEYENSDKGDEAKQRFDQARNKALNSARTISGSLEALGEQMDSFKQMYKDKKISPAMDPAVREFILDLNDPSTPPDHYSIEEDENGRLKYVGKTTQGGHNVNFFLEDIANGENQFTPVEGVEMTDVVKKLMTGVDTIKKEENGQIMTDWTKMATILDDRMEGMMSDDTEFRRLAGGLGYSYEDIVSMDKDDLKAEMKQELMQQIESLTPHSVNDAVANAQRANTLEERQQQNKGIVDSLTQQLFVNKDTSFLSNTLKSRGKPVNIGGRNAIVADIQLKGNKLLIGGFAGKEQVQEVIDLTNPYESARVAQWLGADYNQAIALMASQEEEVDAGDFK